MESERLSRPVRPHNGRLLTRLGHLEDGRRQVGTGGVSGRLGVG